MPPPPKLPEGPWIGVSPATNTAFAGPWGVSFTANLTPDPETGLGKWTEDMFIADDENGTSRGQGPSAAAADAVLMVGALERRRHQVAVRVSAVAAAGRRTACRSRSIRRKGSGNVSAAAAPRRRGRVSCPSWRDSSGRGRCWPPPAPAHRRRRRDSVRQDSTRPDSRRQIDPRNRAFSPQYPLWSDGAHKSRWVFLPDDAVDRCADRADWNLPGRHALLERVQVRRSQGGDAACCGRQARRTGLPPATSGTPSRPTRRSRRRKACRTSPRLRPVVRTASRHAPIAWRVTVRSGPPRSASTCCSCRPTAIRMRFTASRSSPGMVTLATLVREERLAPLDRTLVSQPPRIATRDPQTRAVLGYFAANCGTCHNGSDEIAVHGPSLKFSNLLADARRGCRQPDRSPHRVAGAGCRRRAERAGRSAHAGSERHARSHALAPPVVADAAARHGGAR